jgi:hypothetical protein
MVVDTEVVDVLSQLLEDELEFGMDASDRSLYEEWRAGAGPAALEDGLQAA